MAECDVDALVACPDDFATIVARTNEVAAATTCAKEVAIVAAARADYAVSAAPHMEEATTAAAHADDTAIVTLATTTRQEESNQRAYENIKDMVYAKMKADPSFQEMMILQRARNYFNAKSIELEEAPTMKISDY